MTEKDLHAELRKQTCIPAEKSATDTAVGGALLGLVLIVVLVVYEVTLPWWGWISIPFVLGLLAYLGEYHRLTKD